MRTLYCLLSLLLLFFHCQGQPNSKERIAIMDFQILTNSEDFEQYKWISSGFAETLIDAFSRVDKFSVIERTRLSAVLEEQNLQKNKIIDTTSIVRAGQILGVSRMLLGSCQIYSGQMLVIMRIVNVETGEIYPIRSLPKIIPLSEILQTQERICIEILKQFNIAQEAERKEIQIVTTKSTNSFKAYEFLNRGIEFYNNQQYFEALQMYNLALGYDKKYRKAFFKRGLTNFALSQFDNAANDFESSSGYLKEDTIFILMSDAYYKAGDLKKSYEYIKRAEKINPTNATVKANILKLSKEKNINPFPVTNSNPDSAKFQTIFEFQNGRAKAKMNKKFGYIDTLNRILIPFLFDEIGEFAYGLAPARIGKKWGYIDEKGNLAIKPSFDNVEKFTSLKIARVGQKFKYGIIDINGNEIVPIEYEYINGVGLDSLIVVSKGKGIMQLNSLQGAYDILGRLIIPIIYDRLVLWPGPYIDRNYQYIHASYKDKWGVIDEKNEIIVPFKYDNEDCIRKFSNGFAAIKVNERWGFVNKRGIEVIKPAYDNVIDFSTKFFNVKMRGQWGLVDLNYQEVISPIYDNVIDYSSTNFIVQLHGKFGLIDSNYHVVASLQYDAIRHLKGEFFSAKKDSHWGILDSKNTIHCDFIYDEIGRGAVNYRMEPSDKNYYKSNFLFEPVKKNGKLFWINEKCQCVDYCE